MTKKYLNTYFFYSGLGVESSGVQIEWQIKWYANQMVNQVVRKSNCKSSGTQIKW